MTQNFENGETPVVQNQASRDDMAATRISLGLGYLKMGNMPQAKQNLEKAKKFAPEMVQVYTAFAHYYETVGEHALTIGSYEKALTIKSDDADTLNNYGVYLCRQNQIPAAEKQFLKAIAVPTYLLVAKSYENLASCFLQIDNFDKAENYLSKAILHSPSSASTLFQMIRLQYAMGNYQQAKVFEQRFEKVTRRITPQAMALAYKLHIKLGEKKKAKNYGTMLVKMYPQSWEATQYLLNELELIDADNLAKRFQLTKAKAQGSKPKKRIVKLSPRKKVAEQIKSASSTKVAKRSTPKVNTPKVSTSETNALKANMSTTSIAKKEQKLIKTIPVPIPVPKSAPIASSQVISDVLSMTPSSPASPDKKPDKSVTKLVTSNSASSAEIATAIISATPEMAEEEKEVVTLSAPEELDVNKVEEPENITESITESMGNETPQAAIQNAIPEVAANTETATSNAEEVGIALENPTNAQTPPQIAQTEQTPQTTPPEEIIQEKVAQEEILPVVIAANELEQEESSHENPQENSQGNTQEELQESKATAESLQEELKQEVQEKLPQEDRKIVNIARKPAPIVEDRVTPQAIIVVAPDSEALEAETKKAKSQEVKVAKAIEQKEVAKASTEKKKKPKKNTVKSPRTHTVVSGDTLFGISVQYNVKIKALRRWNKLSKKRKIRINDKLIIENPAVVTKIND